MDGTVSPKMFTDAVDRSFLPEEEKEAFRQAVSREGVSDRLWTRFNDRLIAAIVEIEGSQKKYTETLDAEINRYTKEYEKEKTVLDLRLRDDLSQADSVGQERLWTAYRSRIRNLQSRLLTQVKKSSTSILHDVVLAVVPRQRG
ncbi:hypothetical protein AMJ57_00550 [Parcubacteria bacterium SG8_24]|nr:MAG: hypothetical protein AMJ57_00550 [Parcubacteria bacterium SG8_24]